MEWNKDSELFILVVKQVAKRLEVPLSLKNKEFQTLYTLALNSISDRDFLSKVKLLYSIKPTETKKEQIQKEEKWEVEIESEENPLLSPIFKDSLKNNR